MLLRILIVLAVLAAAAVPALAQDTTTRTYVVPKEMTIYDLAAQENICFEEILANNRYIGGQLHTGTEVELRLDAPLCYDEAGHRLMYYLDGERLDEPVRVDWQVYIATGSETLLDLSRQFNVCPGDIVKSNTPTGVVPFFAQREVFIPDTPPCYDEHGKMLRYAVDGKPLAKPVTWDMEVYVDEVITAYSITLRDVSIELNICEDKLVLLRDLPPDNPLLRYGDVVLYPSGTQPCYAFIRPIPLLGAASRYNLCIEHLLEYNPRLGDGSLNDMIIPLQVLPCHDKQGRRLQFYDADGNRLVTPVYSNWKIGRVETGDKLPGMARRLNVCPEVLLRANPLLKNDNLMEGLEVFIPDTALPCYDAVSGRRLMHFDAEGNRLIPPKIGNRVYVVTWRMSLLELAQEMNICPKVLADLNHMGNNPDNLMLTGMDMLLPDDAPPCYRDYHVGNETAAEISRNLNICIEALNSANKSDFAPGSKMPGAVIKIPLTVPPCYNEKGQRLRFFELDGRTPLPEPVYTTWPVHVTTGDESAYSLSRQYNTCPRVIARQNRVLTPLPVRKNYELIIPQVQPCYDEATGKQIRYNDENGVLLEKPVLSDTPFYIIEHNDSWYYISHLYNICEDELRSANPDVPMVVGREVKIPDAPPCYDFERSEDTGYSIRAEYFCYPEKLETTAGLPAGSPERVIYTSDMGEYCYRRDDILPLVYSNKPVVTLSQYVSPEIAAPCFGVTEDAIRTVNETFYPGLNLPATRRVIPNPTRDCYLNDPNFQPASTEMYLVMPGDTLSHISKQYLTLPIWIAQANNLYSVNLIYPGQYLIIPVFNLVELAKIITGVLLASALFMLIAWQYRRRWKLHKSKRKNDAAA